MAFVDIALAVGAAVGLEGTAAVVGGGALIGAGVGGGYSAITGDGNILNSMLTGAAIGGGGAYGIGSMGAGEAATQAAMAGPFFGGPATAPVAAGVGGGGGAAGGAPALTASQIAALNSTNVAELNALSAKAGLEAGAGSGLMAAPNIITPQIMAGSGAGSTAAGLSGAKMLGYGLAGTTALQLLGNQNRPSAGGGRQENEYDKRLKGYKLSPDYQPYQAPTPNPYYRPTYAAEGGIMEQYDDEAGQDMAGGGVAGLGGYSDGGRMLKGPGDGMSDSIPGVIGGRQPARLADGEFVVPADVVSHLGNGSTDAGAKRLYSMMDNIRQARTGKKKQAPEINVDKYLPVKKASGGIAGYSKGGKSKDEINFDDLSKAEQKYFLDLMARPMGGNPPSGSNIGSENSFEKYMMSQAPQGFQGRIDAKKILDSDEEQYRPASLRAGLSGIAMKNPQKAGITTMPGAVDVAYRSAQRRQEDPYLDLSAYRSLQAMPGKGYAQGINANYTIPFAKGGIAGYAEGGEVKHFYNQGVVQGEVTYNSQLAANVQAAYDQGYSGAQIGAALIASGVSPETAAAATGLSSSVISQVYAGGADLTAGGKGIGDPAGNPKVPAPPIKPVVPIVPKVPTQTYTTQQYLNLLKGLTGAGKTLEVAKQELRDTYGATDADLYAMAALYDSQNKTTTTPTTPATAGTAVYRPNFVPRTTGLNVSDAVKDPYSNQGLQSLYSQMMGQYARPAAPKSDIDIRDLVQKYAGNGAEVGRQLINAGIPVNQAISALKSYSGITPEIVNQAYIGGQALGTAPPPTLNTQYNYSDPSTYYRPPSPSNLVLTRPIVDAAFTPPVAPAPAPAPTVDGGGGERAGGLMSINRKKRKKGK
jgi:hypothetical protein